MAQFVDIIKVWDRDGEEHEFEIDRADGHYTVTLDNVFYSTAESYRQAKDEVIDVIHHRAWTFTKPWTA